MDDTNHRIDPADEQSLSRPDRPDLSPTSGRCTRPGWPVAAVLAPGRDAGDEPAELPLAELKATIAPWFDPEFYADRYPDVVASGQDLLDHFARYGWREGRDPAPDFSTGAYLRANPDIAEQAINPLWHYVVAGRHQGRTPAGPAPEDHTLAARLFDAAYYAARYPDLVACPDLLGHFLELGWRERRNPNRWFDTAFYLAANPDVAAMAINPLLHYAAAGQREGRRTRNASRRQRDLLGALQDAAGRSAGYDHIGAVSMLEPEGLCRLLSDRLPAGSLTLAFSHDNYTTVIGGTQILIADEQARFNAQGGAYLHLSPVLPSLHLADQPGNPLRAILDGVELGCLDAGLLAEALAELGPVLPAERQLVCHCLLGHDPADVQLLHAMLRPQDAVFWLHDYSSLCEGFNLLRNEVQACGAPPPDSQACRICIHGNRRAAHMQAFAALFRAVPFHVVAPSETALSIWREAADLPAASLTIHPHASPLYTARRRSLVPLAKRGTASMPVRIAFAGHPGPHKGWPGFLDIVEDCIARPEYRFFHFTADPAPPHDLPIETVITRVLSTSRDAMRAALETAAIDLVLVLSPWPETFSFVTYEALTAGADVIALADSGNVAAELLAGGRGVVFDHMHDLRAFFSSGAAIEYVRLCYRDGNPSGRLIPCGTTATLALPRQPRPNMIARPAPIFSTLALALQDDARP